MEQIFFILLSKSDTWVFFVELHFDPIEINIELKIYFAEFFVFGIFGYFF